MPLKSKHIQNQLLYVIFFSIFLTLLMSTVASAEKSCKDWVAKVVSVEGRLESKAPDESNWRKVALHDTFCPEESIRTLDNSRAAIQLRSGGIIRLSKWSTIKFPPVRQEEPTILNLFKGKALFFSRHPRKLGIKTPFMNATSEGTEFLVVVDEEKATATLAVLEGRMHVENDAGSAKVKGGHAADAGPGIAPKVRILLRPEDAIQWTLYYPPVLSIDERKLASDANVSGSLNLYLKGDISGAISALEGNGTGPGFYIYRASLLLMRGSVMEAESDLEKVHELDSGYAEALALKSIIALTKNDRDKALSLAKDAVSMAPGSAGPAIALSYAYQANFDIPQALDILKRLVEVKAGNSLAWARLAELKVAMGERKSAIEDARKAVEIDSRQARAHMVLGFAQLSQMDVLAAKESFDTAILLDPAEPLSKLGLGLAKIRRGDLVQGRTEIEIATALDPANPIIRSYLGKGYYEEDRYELAGIQLDMAKEFDKNDPTPYLYDAIRKQVTNRPVEAHHDLQRSVELNDNRAVQRSRLLLDSDLASRSVSLARIYEDLGFRQLALGEGWKAVNMDPTNYSAHRFLSDSYSTLPNSEISRLSELLMAQLTQPLNSNPVQPRLGDKAPSILSGSGPSNPSFSEFNELFTRDRLRLLTSAVIGENGTRGEEIIHTGQSGSLSYSISQSQYETDGFRENAGLEEDLYNAFAQIAISPATTIQAEFRLDESDSGDTDLRFDPDNFSPTFERNTDTKTFRLGIHSTLSPRSDIILSALYQTLEDKVTDITPLGLPPGSTFMGKGDLDGITGEAQYIYRQDDFNLIVGAGHFSGNDRTDLGGLIPVPICFPSGLPFPFCDFGGGDTIITVSLPYSSVEDLDTDYSNIYLYSNIELSEKLLLTVGASGDFYDGSPRDDDQLNPKFGLIWRPTSSTTVRAAAFRAFKRPLISGATIEPTQVAGFQQFFDDSPASDYNRYGLAVEHKFNKDLFAGVEAAYRDLTVPSTVIPFPPELPFIKDFGVDERLARAYLYWSPRTWLSATAEYLYERRDSEDITAPFGPRLTTHRVPFGINLYHPKGYFAKIKTTYFDQKGVFLDVLPGNISTGLYTNRADEFWIVDGSLGMRLPRGMGIFSIEGKNLFDQAFKYQDTDLANTTIVPTRNIFAKLTLLF